MSVKQGDGSAVLTEAGQGDGSVVLSDDATDKVREKKQAADRPLVLVISASSEKLNEIKESLPEKYKGVFVKDEAAAEKFLAKHRVEFVIREP